MGCEVNMPPRFDPALLPEAPDLAAECALWEAGIRYIAGIDEAGRGSLAGPVAVGAVILPADPEVAYALKEVRDSKQLAPGQREECSQQIKKFALAWEVGFASHREIDAFGIVYAVHLAAARALHGLALPPEHLLIDYIFIPENPLPQTALIKGDARSLTIAAASILAKTARDSLLCELDGQFPDYGFAQHKGYCTPGHLETLARLGPSPVHRHSYHPVRGGLLEFKTTDEHR
jgi:ribonuclease HII